MTIKLQAFNMFTAALWVLLMSCINCSTQAEENSLIIRAATYNVEFGKSATPEEIGEMLKPYDLDIIGFCEAPDGDWTSRVGKTLSMDYVFVGKISSANHKNKYKTILSRTPLHDTQEYTIENGAIWNPASTVRAVTTIKGISIAFYSLHISSSGKTGGHMNHLVNTILKKEKSKRIIVVGDFNNKLEDPAIESMREIGMRSTWKDLGINVDKLYTYNALKPEINGGVIDHIFYNTSSGGVASKGGIIELDKHLADHKPVWAEITYPLQSTP